MNTNKTSYIYMHKRRTVIGLSIALLLAIYFFQNASFILRVIATIFSLLFFYFIDHFFDLRYKMHHYLIVIIIALVTLMLSPLYYLYPNYDKIQHFIIPILMSIITYHMVDKLNLELKWKITYTFFITAGILGLFEITEFILDRLFDLKLQGVYIRDLAGFEKFNLLQEPLSDTMNDLILGYIGSIIYAITIFIRNRKEAFPKRN
ncbi:MAG: hypothetical protein Q7R87_01980 [Nanoarchaeota archaeon]|nr:hypothetical protein [Nanoarchaeota archaeon]